MIDRQQLFQVIELFLNANVALEMGQESDTLAQAIDSMISTMQKWELTSVQNLGKWHENQQPFAMQLQIIRALLVAAFLQFHNEAAHHELAEKECNLLLNLLDDETIAIEGRALGYFYLARMCKKTMPVESYFAANKAFEINPDLYTLIELPYRANPIAVKPAQQMIQEACPICGQECVPYYNAVQFFAINYESFFAPSKLWMKCENCGTLHAYNFPVLEQQDFVGCDTSEESAAIEPRYLLQIPSRILNRILQYTDAQTLLDVGIGNGELLSVGAEFGLEVEGVEIALKEAHKVREGLGITVHCCDFLQFETDKKYDIITMGDVIEHVSNPVMALQKAYDLLAEEGVLWLSTPNYNSAFSMYHKFSDPMWNEPWHFTYYSREGMLAILADIGFVCKQYDVSERYNGSMELILKKA